MSKTRKQLACGADIQENLAGTSGATVNNAEQPEISDKVMEERVKTLETKAKLLDTLVEAQEALRQDVDLVETQLVVSHQHNDVIVPTDYTRRLLELEKVTGSFAKPIQISVSQAYEVEAVYANMLAMTLGRKTRCLYNATKYSLYDQYPDLTGEQRDVKLIPLEASVYKEFADINYLVKELMTEGKDRRKWSLNFRDGMYLVAQSTFQAFFGKLLDLVTNPNDEKVESRDLARLVSQIKEGLKRLFGRHNNTVYRLDAWLRMFDGGKEKFPRQEAFQELRNLYPKKAEVAKQVLTAIGLDKADLALEDGLEDWGTTKTRKRQASSSDPSSSETEDEPTGSIFDTFLRNKKLRKDF
ncbi:unnamed protein product [Oikopleura dioica]|uniref:Uncharacterized protein n=1 Tax=Oikopleura dioica TaxID=34765 RepID=E4XCJ9_OIKDI|nr:unnamed protein product [Oikopleura dioica]